MGGKTFKFQEFFYLNQLEVLILKCNAKSLQNIYGTPTLSKSLNASITSKSTLSVISVLSYDSFCHKFVLESIDIFLTNKQMSFTVMYLDFYTPDSVSSLMEFFNGGS